MVDEASDADDTDFKITNQIKAALEYRKKIKEIK